MNCYQIILQLVDTYPNDEPIFIEDVKKYVLKYYNKTEYTKVLNNIKVILNRMKIEGIIKQAEKGVYYKPSKTVWGRDTVPPIHKIRDYRYLVDKEGNIKGYVTGAKLFNLVGLTTQIPNTIDIVTNECPNNNKYFIKRYNILICKPKIKITNENYKYLQLLDILTNNDKINIEVENPLEVIYEYIKESNLSFEKILKYARETNNKKALIKLWSLAR